MILLFDGYKYTCVCCEVVQCSIRAKRVLQAVLLQSRSHLERAQYTPRLLLALLVLCAVSAGS
jgi:hypothetical protein